MKRICILGFLLYLFCACLQKSLIAADNYAIFYEKPDYKGRSFKIYAGEKNVDLAEKIFYKSGKAAIFNDKISSIKIVGKKVKVWIYQDVNFGEPSAVFTSNVPNLKNIKVRQSGHMIRKGISKQKLTWIGRVSSIKVYGPSKVDRIKKTLKIKIKSPFSLSNVLRGFKVELPAATLFMIHNGR
ncbi:hypothetical protein ACFL35_02515, partial [Candidatus Riflebacteria bacterium]